MDEQSSRIINEHGMVVASESTAMEQARLGDEVGSLEIEVRPPQVQADTEAELRHLRYENALLRAVIADLERRKV